METKEIKKNNIMHYDAKTNEMYGYHRRKLVEQYLLSDYPAEECTQEVDFDCLQYKVLRKDTVTAFYDRNGNTIFDVTNERLANEYAWLNYKGIDGAVEKLTYEISKEKDQQFAIPVLNYLMVACRGSENLANDLCQAHKNWAACKDYINKKVLDTIPKEKQRGCVPVAMSDDAVFEWAEEYYHLDDKDAVEKVEKEKDEALRKSLERKAKTKTPKPYVTTPVPTEKSSVKPDTTVLKKKTEKNADNGAEGQLDFFSMLGIKQ